MKNKLLKMIAITLILLLSTTGAFAAVEVPQDVLALMEGIITRY